MIIGIGTDLVFCTRFEKIFKTSGEKLFKRLFTENERERADKRIKRFESYGKIFAAKEAYLKAAGDNQGVSWQNIEVLHNAFGKPYIALNGKAKEKLKELSPQNSIQKIELSITDEPPYAQAFVVIWCV